MTWTNGGEKISNEDLNKAIVEVYFTAKLNEDAELGSQGNVNKAVLNFSCNPNVDQNGKVKDENGNETEEGTEDHTDWDYVIAFTYKIEVNKQTQDLEQLTGAEFTLEKKLTDGSRKHIDCKETST